MIALLRNEIIRIYDKQEKLGYCPSYMKENLKKMKRYVSYLMMRYYKEYM